MILFFETSENTIIAVQKSTELNEQDSNKLIWLFGNARLLSEKEIKQNFIGPRREMITPWSTNAVEITQNMGIKEITRI